MSAIVKSKIDRIFKQHFLIAPVRLKFTRKLNDLGLNFYEQMEMMWYLEREFKINLPDKDVDNIKTVGDAVAAVERCIAA